VLRYILRRILISVPVLVLISIASFLIITAMPGDPVDMMIDPSVGAEALEKRRAALGLDQPIPVRYARWLREVATGNLGYSMLNGSPVSNRIGERIVPTVLLMGSALLLSLALAIPLGILSAIRQNSPFDYLATVLAFVGVSTPTFFVGLGLIYLISVKLDLLPTSMMQTPGAPFSLWDRVQHWILPTVVLGLNQVAIFTRYVRSSMLEVLGQDYVRTARAKGLAERMVVVRHALRNSLIPLISLLGLQIPLLFGGAVITEQIFVWPGIGRLTVEAVFQRDHPVLMGLIMMTAVLVVIGNLLADVAYAVVDPRIRYESA
jgi:peptide/nickel transport system permease protein